MSTVKVRSRLSLLAAALLFPMPVLPMIGPAPAQAQVADRTHGVPTIGDLVPFRAIAEDTLRIVKTGDLAAAKARIKDLETAWDKAEDKMRPRDPSQWRAVDKAIDRALEQLRASRPDQAGSAASLDSLLTTMDSVGRS